MNVLTEWGVLSSDSKWTFILILQCINLKSNFNSKLDTFYLQVILVGAGTRVPKVQEKLYEVVGMELGKSINTDEAAAMGAVYKAADLSNGFKVKKFLTKDAVLFPIQVSKNSTVL